MKIVPKDALHKGLLKKDIGSAFSEMMDRFFGQDGMETFFEQSDFLPRVDLVENGKGVTVKADIPGLEKKDLNVEIDGRDLVISGRRDEKRESTEGGVTRYERHSGSFRRSIRLPEDVETGKVKAVYDKGVLNIEIPRLKEKQLRRVIVK